MITLTSHYPYNFEGIFKAARLDTGYFKGTLMGNYLTSMKYFDDQFGMFIRRPEQRGLLDSSVIAVYGDHTAIPAWDRSKPLRNSWTEARKDEWEWKDMQRIPLLIRIPGGTLPSGEIDRPAGLIDLPDATGGSYGSEVQDRFWQKPFWRRQYSGTVHL